MATITLPPGSTSENLQAAIDTATSGDFIQLSGDMEFLNTVTVPAGLSLTILSTTGNVWMMAQTVTARHFLVQGELVLESVVLDGNATIASSSTTGGLLVEGRLTLASGAVIQACYSDEGGAVMLDGGSMLLEDGSRIENNIAQSKGGGVYIGSGGLLQMTGGVISGNLIRFDSGSGAGVFVFTGGRFVMSGGSITQNTLNLTGNQGGVGGGVAVQGGTFEMSAGTVSYNRSQQYGAGIGIGSGSTATITGGLIEYNTAEAAGGGSKLSGGGIAIINGTLNLGGGTIAHNEAVYGGGIYLGYGSTTCRLNMTGGILEENYAHFYGGGIRTQNQGSSVSIQSDTDPENTPTIRGNSTSYYGGGISVFGSSLTVDGCDISGNSAINGGGLWVDATGTARITGATSIADNTATGSGGGIYTGSYSYADPADLAAYQNLSTAPDTLFEGNQSAQAYYPPGNAGDFTNIGYATTSILASNGYVHPLNNDDINYAGPDPLVLYSVTYNANGGIGSYLDAGLESGTLYTVLSPAATGVSRPGYSFVGWNTQPNGNGDYLEPGDRFSISGDVELFAQWTLIEGPYEVVYDANGGTGSRADTGIPNGANYTILSPEQAGISRENHAFTGWNTQPDGGGTSHQPGDIITITGNVILYAQWTFVAGPYNVIYDANGGTGTFTDASISNGTIYTVLSPVQVGINRESYTFTGWNTQPNGSGTPYQPEDTLLITGNVTLYAQWSPVEGPYYVLYDANCGTGRYVDAGLPGETVYTVLSPEQTGIGRTGYTFLEWNTRPDGSGIAYRPGDTIVITENVILYAQWTQACPERPCCAPPCYCYCCCCQPHYCRGSNRCRH